MPLTPLECRQINLRIRGIQCQLGWNNNYGSKASVKPNKGQLFLLCRTERTFLENSGLVNAMFINLLRKIGTVLAKDKVEVFEWRN